MFKSTFGNAISSMMDKIVAPLPWVPGVTVTIVRAGASTWQKWLEANSEGGMADALYRAGLKTTLAEALSSGSDDDKPRPGWRTRKKAPKAARLDAQAVLDRAIDRISPEDLKKSRASLNMIKPGVAQILIAGWDGVRGDDGAYLEPTLRNKLIFVGWEGYHVRIPGGLGGGPFADIAGNEYFLSREQFAQRDIDSTLSKAIASGIAQIDEYDGNPRNEAGDLLTLEDEPVGDTITAWVRHLSDENENYVAAKISDNVRD